LQVFSARDLEHAAMEILFRMDQPLKTL